VVEHLLHEEGVTGTGTFTHSLTPISLTPTTFPDLLSTVAITVGGTGAPPGRKLWKSPFTSLA
jgi:hypothetical protein